jgi:DNA repair exonuclease SbcCD ATPase subunit
MNIETLELHNFRSFYGQHHFNFAARGSGLYYLTGENWAEPRLGGNGSGKTSLIEAICWAFYGRTTRGLRGPQVCNWKAECGCEVAVRLDGYVIRRGWSPNKLTVEQDGSALEVTQEDLERDLLPLSYFAFINAVVLGQFGSFFFDLTPANKMAVVSDVLSIETWGQRSQAARKYADELIKQKDKAESRAETIDETITRLRDEIEQYRVKSAEFVEQRDANIRLLEQQSEYLNGEKVNNDKECEQSKKDMRDLKRKDKKLSKNLTQLRDKRDRVRKEVIEASTEQKALDEEDERFKDEIKRLRGLTSECPYCFQSVDSQHLQGEVNKVKAKRAELFARMATHYETLTKKKKELEAIDKQVEADEKDRREYSELYQRANATLEATKKKAVQIQERLSNTDEQLANERRREDIYHNEYMRYRQSLADHLRERRRLHRYVEANENEAAGVSYWVDGFKQVRLFLIEELVRFLEMETNNALSALGLTGWHVRFAMQRETKDGSVSRGFSLMIYSPANKKEVPWEVWSGGETQRLRLAGALAMSALILNAKGVTTNLLMLDEPSSHLDAEGMGDILDALRQYSVDTNKQIWLVEHRAMDSGQFDETVTVTKNEQGQSEIAVA